MTNGETTWNYTYNADGLRTERTDGTDTYRYVYDGGKLTFMARNGLYLRFAYTPEGTPLSILYKNETYYYVTNLQGDVTAILSQNGYVMVEYTYDAWGNLLSTTGPLANSLGLYNPLRYRGYTYDYETGLYYLQSRYYDPEMGRFINADALLSQQDIKGNNTYAYCLNNPVNLVDSSGNYPQHCFDSPAAQLGYMLGEWFGNLLRGIPTKEEHYNRNNNQLEVLTADPKEIIESSDWEEQPDAVNKYHKHTIGEQGEDASDNVKYMTTDGKKEVIINFSNPLAPEIVTDPFNVGTYNFGTDLVTHAVWDVLPYWLWGNSEEDSGWEYAFIRIFGA